VLDAWVRFYLLALFNSFSVDYLFRQRITKHISFFLSTTFRFHDSRRLMPASKASPYERRSSSAPV